MLTTARGACLTCLALCLTLSPATRSLGQEAPNGSRTPLPQGTFESSTAASKYLYLQGVTRHWQTSADGRDYAELQAAVDRIVAADGTLRVPVAQAQPFGRTILLAYRVTQKPVYYQAAKQLRQAMQPAKNKTDSSTAPFLADFGVTFHDRTAVDQAASILLHIDTFDRVLETGLLPSSDVPSTLTKNATYALDLLESIDCIPVGYPQRKDLIEALNKTISALSAQESDTQIWEKGGPATTAAVFLEAYVIARGVRLDAMAESNAFLADHAFKAASAKAPGSASEGARLLAQSEQDQSQTQAFGQGKTVMVDAWFNSQTRTDAAGSKELFHYKWNDEADSGFSFFGRAFQRFGAQLDQLAVAPTRGNLSAAQVYLIVSPDIPSKNPNPHAMDKPSADAIEAWVKDGGVLVLMMNDGANTEFTQVNTLSERFGMHFNAVDKRSVQDSHFEQGAVIIPANTGIFAHAHHAFMKDIGIITLGGTAHAVVGDGSEVFMAVAAVGRGTVFAVTDPWLYNEYTDGRKLPPEFDNFAAAVELSGWLLKQTE